MYFKDLYDIMYVDMLYYRFMGDSENQFSVPDRAAALTYYGSDGQQNCPYCWSNNLIGNTTGGGQCPWHSETSQSAPSSSGLRYRRRHRFASGSDLPRQVFYLSVFVYT